MNSLKEVEKRRKQVFKPLLENPFTQAQFPRIEPSIQDQLLDYLLHLLEDIAKYENLIKSKPSFTPERPEILNNITLGFNSTVQRLEKQAHTRIAQSPPSSSSSSSPLSYIFVCKADIQPQLLTSQFPVLCYTASTHQKKVKLIQLPKGSIDRIEKVLGKKTGIIGLTRSSTYPDSFTKLIENHVKDVEVPWLENVRFVKPKVKMLKTSAPILPKRQKNQKVQKKK